MELSTGPAGGAVSTPPTVRLDGRRTAAGAGGPLTGRELEVLRLTAQAYSNAQIASRLHITQATVKRHLTNIYAKLNAVSRADAIRKAAAAKLLSSDGAHVSSDGAHGPATTRP